MPLVGLQEDMGVAWALFVLQVCLFVFKKHFKQARYEHVTDLAWSMVTRPLYQPSSCLRSMHPCALQ